MKKPPGTETEVSIFGPAGDPGPDETLLEMGLRLTPAQRLRWLEDTVEELLPWLGLAQRAARGRDPRQ